jgi:hypothetical protein
MHQEDTQTQTQTTTSAAEAPAPSQTQAAAPTATQTQAKPASSNPDDRAQAFEAQQGAPIPEAHSGEKLLVTAYACIWVIAMIFVMMMWLRQRKLSERLATLEKAIDKADKASNAFDDDDERMMKTVVKNVPKREMD